MANKVYLVADGSAITFQDSGGTVTLTLQNLAFGAGRISARYDRGAGAKPQIAKWRAKVQFETAPIVGEAVDILLSESDGTDADGTPGTADAALTSDKRRNLEPIGRVVVDTTSVTTDIIASGTFLVTDRYFSLGVWNGSAGDNLENTANANVITVQFYAEEIQ
jgi:hypothetical protein